MSLPIRSTHAAVLMLALPAILAGCGQPFDAVSGPVVEEARGALKDDALGSCATVEGDTCGAQSPDGCWCDEQCAQFGDCCADVAAVCDDEPVPEPAGCAVPATYAVEVEVVWDPATVPNPHFSPVVGATHDASLSLWTPGGMATNGIEVMAETGATGPLVAEVQDAIADGTAGAVVLGSPIPVSPGGTTVSVEVDETHDRVTLVTMVAPSPDWFVGVSGLELCVDGEWVDQTVDLTVWDAGTDSGLQFTSPNQDTVPAEPITVSTAFFAPAGTMTFVRQ